MDYTIKKRIKDLFNIKAGGDLDGMLVEQNYSEVTPYPIYANSAINDGIYGYTNNYKYKKESITVTARGNLGIAFYRTKPFNAIGRLLILLSKNKNINLKYINYILQNNKVIGNQTAIPQLTAPEFGNQIIELFEDYKKQKKIANYLDKETSKIDRKISILEQKYEKLEEYKQSVIFETVTKGLYSNVEMKDSGIDWIGVIPNHWEVKRVKEFYKLGMGQTILKEDLIEDGKYPVYSATAEDKFFGYVNKINNPLNVGDLVIPARGNSIGHVKLVKETVVCTQTTIYMKQKTKIDSNFVFYYLLGNKPQIFFFDDTAIPQITVEQINGRLILVPSANEQKEIVSYLNNLCSKLNKKLEIIKKQIELLKEYKQTIIYEAVTGKMEIL